MTCPSCSREVTLETAKHCPECGSSLPIACGACGCENPAGSKFCAECGRPIRQAPASGSETIVAPRDVPEGEAPSALPHPAARPGDRIDQRAEIVTPATPTTGHDTTQTGREPSDPRKLITASYVCAVVFPVAGFVLAIITLVRGRLGHGLAALALSLSMVLFWMGFVRGFISAVDVQTYVSCEPSLGGMSCAVERRSGDAAATVCWDVMLTCRNGVRAVASGCHPVPPGVGSKSTRTIGYSDIRRWNDCDEVESMAVDNLRFS